MLKHEVSSENKDTAYTATQLLFYNVRLMALEKVGNWELCETMTDSTNGHYITEYRDGKMFVRAVSYGNSHIYSFGEIEDAEVSE